MTRDEPATTADVTFWDRIADQYAKQPVANPEAFERKIAITKAQMKPSDEVLDVGCGTGSLVLRLAPFAAHVHGLDASSEMMRIARDKAEASRVANVTFHTGAFDERFAVFGPASLDGICAYSLLHLVRDRRAVLDRIFRLLKPGGFFISSTVCLGESLLPYTPMLGVMRWLGRAPFVQVFSKRALEGDVRAAGLRGSTRARRGGGVDDRLRGRGEAAIGRAGAFAGGGGVPSEHGFGIARSDPGSVVTVSIPRDPPGATTAAPELVRARFSVRRSALDRWARARGCTVWAWSSRGSVASRTRASRSSASPRTSPACSRRTPRRAR